MIEEEPPVKEEEQKNCDQLIDKIKKHKKKLIDVSKKDANNQLDDYEIKFEEDRGDIQNRMLEVPAGHLADRIDSKSQKIYPKRRNQPMEENSPKRLDFRAVKSDNASRPMIDIQIEVQDVSPCGKNQPAWSDDSSSVFNSENSIPLS